MSAPGQGDGVKPVGSPIVIRSTRVYLLDVLQRCNTWVRYSDVVKGKFAMVAIRVLRERVLWEKHDKMDDIIM